MSYYRNFLNFTFILSSLTMSACSAWKEITGEDRHQTSDSATPEERAVIIKSVTKIEAIAARLGYKVNFHTLPIYVTSEEVQERHRLANCTWDADRKGLYIALNRTLFEREKEEPAFQIIMTVLLHEIGHCYLGRKHEYQGIKKEGSLFAFHFADSAGGVDLLTDEFSPSVMYVTSDTEGPPFLGIPQPLENYYVLEILNGQRVSTPEEVEKLNGVEIFKH